MARETHDILLFNMEALFVRRLFDPETTDMGGKPLDKPRFSVVLRIPKTKAYWYEEPAFQPLVSACKAVIAREMSGIQPGFIVFPVKDGDAPNRNGVVQPYYAGHWYLRADSTYAPTVKQLQNGVEQELPALTLNGHKLWTDGDIAVVQITVAKRMTDAMGIKTYLKALCFTSKGQDVKIGNGTTFSMADAMAQAEKQGVHIKTDPSGPQPHQGGFPGAQANPGGFGTGPGPPGPQANPGWGAQQDSPQANPSWGAGGGAAPGQAQWAPPGSGDSNKPPF